MLGHLLHRHGVDSVIVENRSRQHVIERVRAGVLEQGTVDLMREAGVGQRLDREGLRHDGLYLAFGGNRHRIDLSELTGGRAITVYGQNEVVKDLIDARTATARPLVFEADDVVVDGIAGDEPVIRYRTDGRDEELRCDFIAGCDGFHGICRQSIPGDVLRIYERAYPFGWLGILAEAAPSSHELVYSHHERGFALFSMRSPTVTRLYLQCAPDEDLDAWPDDADLERAPGAAGDRRRLAAERGTDLSEGRDRDAELRRRADALRPSVPRRRRGAHRAADRRQGPQPGDGGRLSPVVRARGALPRRERSPARSLLRAVAARGRGGRSGSRGS